MGKPIMLSEKDLYEMVLPGENDVLGVVQRMLGFDIVMVKLRNKKTKIE